LIVTPAESNQNLADFEVAWAWVDSVYPAFDLKGVDWSSVYAEYRPQAEAARGDEIYQVLHDMLSVLDDAHVYYKTNGGARFFPHVSPRLLADRNKFSSQLVRRYFDGELLLAGKDGVEYGILDGNVGYIHITHFNEDGMMDDFPSVMSFVGGTDGLIIDVRNNTGGDHDKVEAVVGRFIGSPMAWPLAFQADGALVDPWPAIQPNGGHARYDNPVVVLINGASLSSGELFPEVMKQLQTVTLVGDTTAGASCNDRGGFRGDRRLPSGKMIHIPTWCITRYDGLPWELVGIAPDIRVVQTEADIAQGFDRQLEYAIGMFR
jgi:C-terminal processing protease CtpA/Prc